MTDSRIPSGVSQHRIAHVLLISKPGRLAVESIDHIDRERSPNGEYLAMRWITHQRPQAVSKTKFRPAEPGYTDFIDFSDCEPNRTGPTAA